MSSDLIELILEKQAKRKQREDFVNKHREEWAIKGEELRVRRRQYGLCASDIAEQIRISTSTLRKFERGIYVRNVKMIEQTYELILRLEEKIDENSQLSDQIRHLRHLLERGHSITIEVDGRRFDIPTVPKTQPQNQRSRRSVI